MSYSPTDIIEVEEDSPSELLSFFLPGAVDAALRAEGFSVGEEIGMIVQMIRDAPNIHTRLAALKYWNSRGKEILEASGYIQKMTAQITGGPNNQALLTAQTSRLMEVGHTNSNIGVDNDRKTNETGDSEGRPPEAQTGEEKIIEVEPREPIGAHIRGPEQEDPGPGEADCGPGPDHCEAGPEDPGSGGPLDDEGTSDEPITVDGDAGTFTRTGHFPPETSKRGLSGR